MTKKAAGIVAEYNPFHNGHLWQLQALRQSLGDVPVIACMSGSIVQRGELALTDPWTRAEMAVRGGVDLVLALPAVFSLRSADFFAAGGVDLLAATGLVDTLVCGKEKTCSAATLESAASWSLSPAAEKIMRFFVQKGSSYAAAWEQAALQAEKEGGLQDLASWFTDPNNILALAYQKRILQKNYPLALLPLPRQGSSYNETVLETPYASASAIRTALECGRGDDNGKAEDQNDPESRIWETISRTVPESTLILLRSYPHFLQTATAVPASLSLPSTGSHSSPSDAYFSPSTSSRSDCFFWKFRSALREERLAELLAYLLLSGNSLRLYESSSAGQDLCHRFFRERAALSEGYAAFCKRVANRRDPLPMVRRLSLQLLLNRSRSFWLLPQEPTYLRVLAFNDRGRVLLKQMKKTASLPLLTKLGLEQRYRSTPLYPQLQTDLAATDLFNLTDGRTGYYGEDFFRSPRYVKE